MSPKSQVVTLLEHNVVVGLGTIDPDRARNTRFDAAWVGTSVCTSAWSSTDTSWLGVQAALESGDTISKAQAIALVSTNVEKLLGIERDPDETELVVTTGGDLLEYSKVVAVISPSRGVVDIF